MRFSVVSIFVAALAGSAAAAPATVPPTAVPDVTGVTGILGGSNLVGELTGVVSQVEKGLNVDGLEQKLQTILGSTLAKVEGALGQTLAQKLLSLVESGLPPQVVQAVGQGLALVQQGVAIETVDTYVKGMTNGAASSLEKTLGVANIANIVQL